MRFIIIDKMKLTPFELKLFARLGERGRETFTLEEANTLVEENVEHKSPVTRKIHNAADMLILSGIIEWVEVRTSVRLSEMGWMFYEDNRDEIELVLQDHLPTPTLIPPPIGDQDLLDELCEIFTRKMNEKDYQKVRESSG